MTHDLQSGIRPGIATTETVALLGWSFRAPAGTSYRLDQPCVQQHGSLGGWLRAEAAPGQNGDEIAFTMLWRPLHYWSPQVGGDDLDAAQAAYVERALAQTRRDSKGLEVHQHTETRLGAAGHAAALLDLSIGVRRRLGSVRLHRRQALWTCAETRRHLAFEVSALAQDDDCVQGWFSDLTATLTCHEPGRGGAASDG